MFHAPLCKDYRKDALIKDWLDIFQSQSTRANYGYAINYLFDLTQKTPNELVEIGRNSERECHNLVIRAMTKATQERHLSRNTVGTIYTAGRSFLKAQGVEFDRRPKGLKNISTYESEYVYKQTEVAEIVNVGATTIRDKAIVAFFAQSGQRRQILHVLRIRNVKHILEGKGGDGPYVISIPTVFNGHEGENCNKGSTRYQFAIGEDAARYLRLMVSERKNWGEQVDDDSFLFRSYSRALEKRTEKGGVVIKIKRDTRATALVPDMFTCIVADAAERAGVQSFTETSATPVNGIVERGTFHPHGFRRYFKHQARSGGIFDGDFLNYCIGHALPYAGVYDRFDVEYVRKQYAKAEPYLSVSDPKRSVSPEYVNEQFIKLAKMVGFTDDQIKAFNSGEEITREQVVKKVVNGNSNNNSNNKEFRAVTEEDMIPCLEQGWEVKSNLPSGKVLLCRDKTATAAAGP